MRAAPAPVRRSAVFQPCAWCGLPVEGTDADIHIREICDLGVRIVHHLRGGDAASCATDDPLMDTLIGDGVGAAEMRRAIEQVKARGEGRVTQLRRPLRRLKKARAK